MTTVQSAQGQCIRNRLATLLHAFSVLTLSLLITVKTFGATTAPETDARGPYSPMTGEYRLPAAVDPSVLANVPTEIWARVFWPKDLSQKRPILFFLHGNHGTCGSGTAPRNDSGCGYTNEGVCPAGSVVTPNHEGYNYAAEHLASWGFVVVSINANRGITCGGGDPEDWGLILARGRLILRHIELWNQWVSRGGSPATLGDPSLFKGNVDMTEVGLMGHSRGGEGIRAALELFREPGSQWPAKIPKLDIKALFEIGAVDGQSNRTLDAESVAWNQLLPLCDGDVSDLQGRMPFERMSKRMLFDGKSESRPTPKSLLMVWGANHNFFNTEWQSNEAFDCAGEPEHKPLFSSSRFESKEQQSIAIQEMSAFFRAHLGSNRDPSFAQHFDPVFEQPKTLTSQSRVDRDFLPSMLASNVFRVEDFTSPTGQNPAGTTNLAAGITINHDGYSSPTIGSIKWAASGDDVFYQANFRDPGKGVNISSYRFLDFRVGNEFNETGLANPANFTLQLVASDDTVSSSVEIVDFAEVKGPPSNINLSQTIRIPLDEFRNIDLSSVRGVRFIFNKSPKGHIRLSQVRFEELNSSPPLTSLRDLGPTGSQPVNLLSITKSVPSRGKAWVQMEPMTPFELPRPVRSEAVQSSDWFHFQKRSHSPFLRGETAIEVVVQSSTLFPVMDSLPVLNIENTLLPLSRYPTNGQTDQLIFTVPLDVFLKLPASGRAQVQYGLTNPSRIWTLPDFNRSRALESLGL